MPGITQRINGGYLGKTIFPSNVIASSNIFAAGMLSATSHYTLTRERLIPNLNFDNNVANLFNGTYRIEVICVGGGGGSGGCDAAEFAGCGGGGGGIIAGDFLVTTGDIFEIGIGGGGGAGLNGVDGNSGTSEGGKNGGGSGGSSGNGGGSGQGGGGGGWTGMIKDFIPYIIAGGGAGGGGAGQLNIAGQPINGFQNIDNTAGGGIQQRGPTNRMEGGAGSMFGTGPANTNVPGTQATNDGGGSGGGGGGFPGGNGAGMFAGMGGGGYPNTGTSGGMNYAWPARVSNIRIFNGGFGRSNAAGTFGGGQGGFANAFGNVFSVSGITGANANVGFIIGNNGKGGNSKYFINGDLRDASNEGGWPGNITIRYEGPQKGRGGNVNFFNGYTYHHFPTANTDIFWQHFTNTGKRVGTGGANVGTYLFIA